MTPPDSRLLSIDSFSPQRWYPFWPLNTFRGLPWLWQESLPEAKLTLTWDPDVDLCLLLARDVPVSIPRHWLDAPTPGLLRLGAQIVAAKVPPQDLPRIPQHALDQTGLSEWLQTVAPSLPVDSVTGSAPVTLYDIREWLLQRLSAKGPPQGVESASHTLDDAGNQTYIGREVNIERGVLFDSRPGPIVLADRVQIRPFSYLVGPLYVGPNTQLDNVRLSESWIGPTCRLGGEVDKTWILGFTNKHHDGFLGHSVVGRWCNLGAETTVSDLKNTYGEIRQSRLGHVVSTGRIKAGPLIGDHVRTGIGTLIGTGAVIGPGSMLLADDGVVNGEVAPLSWRVGAARQVYEVQKLTQHIETMMARRGERLTEGERALLLGLGSLSADS